MRFLLPLFFVALLNVAVQGAETFLPNYSVAPVSNALPWQMVGYRWQQDHPTSATVTNNLNMVTLGADNTGVTPSDSVFATAKSTVARGHAIYFPAGTYLFTNSILVNASESFVIRGDGMQQTIIKSQATTAASGNSAIRFEGGFGSTTLLTADAVRGNTNVSVTSTSGFAPGTFLFIAEDINPAKIDGNWEHPSAKLLHQWNQVHAISSGTVTLVKPLYRGYETANGALLNRYTLMTNVGVENLTIFQTSNSVAAGRSLLFFKCADFWANNVEITNAGIHGLVADFSLRGTIRNCYVHDVQTNQQSAYAFQITDNAGEILLENNIAEWHSSGFLIQYASGCVISYNYARGGNVYNQYPVSVVKYGIITHGDAAEFNLFEGNIASRATADDFWGGNYYTMWFRNWARGYQLDQNGSQVANNRYSQHIDETNYYHSVVGQIIGHSTTNAIWPLLLASDEESGSLVYPGDDPQVEATTFVHGNYDLTSQSLTLSNGYAFTFDASYYLASKPAWYSNLSWPSIGADIATMTNNITLTNTFNFIPAQARYYGVDYSTPSFSARLGLGRSTLMRR